MVNQERHTAMWEIVKVKKIYLKQRTATEKVAIQSIEGFMLCSGRYFKG